VMFSGQIAGLDRDGPVIQNRQFHFRFHGQIPFRKTNLFSDFMDFCQPSLSAA
jgi:hypothetical protein